MADYLVAIKNLPIASNLDADDLDAFNTHLVCNVYPMAKDFLAHKAIANELKKMGYVLEQGTTRWIIDANALAPVVQAPVVQAQVPANYGLNVLAVAANIPVVQAPANPAPANPDLIILEPFVQVPVDPDLIILEPFAQVPIAQVPVDQSPFAQSPFAQGSFAPGPFAQSPFAQGPFAQSPFAQGSFAPGPFAPGPFDQVPFDQDLFAQNEVFNDEFYRNVQKRIDYAVDQKLQKDIDREFKNDQIKMVQPVERMLSIDIPHVLPDNQILQNQVTSGEDLSQVLHNIQIIKMMDIGKEISQPMIENMLKAYLAQNSAQTNARPHLDISGNLGSEINLGCSVSKYYTINSSLPKTQQEPKTDFRALENKKNRTPQEEEQLANYRSMNGGNRPML